MELQISAIKNGTVIDHLPTDKALKVVEILDLKNSKKYLESKEKIQIPEDIKELIEERKKAREEKNWQLSDLLRDQIKEKGYIVKDTKEGMTIDKI